MKESLQKKVARKGRITFIKSKRVTFVSDQSLVSTSKALTLEFNFMKECEMSGDPVG